MKSLTKKSLLLLMMMCIALTGFAQIHSNFTFKPEKPANGQTIEISYDAKGTPLEGRQNITSVIYQYINYKWVAADVPFTGANNLWKASFKTPANCGFLAVKFKSDTLTDNNRDTGYFIMLQDKDRPGALAPGSYLGWGVARSPKTEMDIPGYMKFEGISDTATYMWFNQEITFNQANKSKLVIPYSRAVKNYFKDAATPKLRAVITFLTRADATEDELQKARTISGNIMGDEKLKDSIENIITKKFPNGNLAKLAAYRNISKNKEMPALIQASEKFLVDFPAAETNVDFDKDNFINYGTVYQNIIVVGGYLTKDDSYLKKYIDVLPYNILSTIFYKIVGIPYKRKDETPERLLTKAEIMLTRYKYFLANQPADLAYLSPLEWKTNWEQERAKFEYIPYISLLMSAGRDEEAFKYTEVVEKYLEYKDATVNNYYAILLQKRGETTHLNEVLKYSLYNNQATPEMLEMVKADYIRQNGSDKGYDDYLSKLKNPADKAEFEKMVAEGMINKAMPEWSMKDMNGKVVSSKALRGKTVVLDFWATWCVPCKASFPGMKLAVDKYKNDKDVVFYFVDTEERGTTYKAEVMKYIKENNYPFNILFDNTAAGSKQNSEVFDRICKEFTISGIPQKLFIDKNGKLRFISVGYNGSASALADDISTLVEMTKTAK